MTLENNGTIENLNNYGNNVYFDDIGNIVNLDNNGHFGDWMIKVILGIWIKMAILVEFG